MPNLLRVRLSLKGRPMRSYTFAKKEVSIGRDPDCDIHLENTGISRRHARIERTPGGYVLEDLGSSNGTFLNDEPVGREFLGHDDVVQIGKFALWVGVESDRRESPDLRENPAPPTAYEGTVVLDPDSLLEMQRKSRGETPRTTRLPADSPPPRPDPVADGRGRDARLLAIAAAFAAGVVVSAAVTRLLGG